MSRFKSDGIGSVEPTKISTSPARRPPPGACDCHVHICDASGKYPIHGQSPYVPPHAPYETHRAMLDAVGLERSVAVQLMAYGEDNSLIAESLSKANGAMRGIASCDAQVTDAELERLHAAGIRGLRFYFELPKPITGVKPRGIGLEDLIALASRMKALNWIAEISATCDRFVELAPRLEALQLPIVLEHMAGCSAARGAKDPGFQRLLGLLGTGLFWTKLTVCGISDRPPSYEDLRPLHDALVSAAPDRMIWGSDWPHILRSRDAPDVGQLIDIFDAWIDHDADLRRRIFADNPARLFDF